MAALLQEARVATQPRSARAEPGRGARAVSQGPALPLSLQRRELRHAVCMDQNLRVFFFFFSRCALPADAPVIRGVPVRGTWTKMLWQAEK